MYSVEASVFTLLQNQWNKGKIIVKREKKSIFFTKSGAEEMEVSAVAHASLVGLMKLHQHPQRVELPYECYRQAYDPPCPATINIKTQINITPWASVLLKREISSLGSCDQAVS